MASGIDRHLDLALLVFGVPAVIGVIGAGALVDRWMRSMVLVATALLDTAYQLK